MAKKNMWEKTPCQRWEEMYPKRHPAKELRDLWNWLCTTAVLNEDITVRQVQNKMQEFRMENTKNEQS